METPPPPWNVAAYRLLTKHLHLLLGKILPLFLGEYSEDRSSTFFQNVRKFQALRGGTFQEAVIFNLREYISLLESRPWLMYYVI
jgi:hypothetical protein